MREIKSKSTVSLSVVRAIAPTKAITAPTQKAYRQLSLQRGTSTKTIGRLSNSN